MGGGGGGYCDPGSLAPSCPVELRVCHSVSGDIFWKQVRAPGPFFAELEELRLAAVVDYVPEPYGFCRLLYEPFGFCCCCCADAELHLSLLTAGGPTINLTACCPCGRTYWLCPEHRLTLIVISRLSGNIVHCDPCNSGAIRQSQRYHAVPTYITGERPGVVYTWRWSITEKYAISSALCSSWQTAGCLVRIPGCAFTMC